MNKGVFSSNVDINKNAYLNWRISPDNYIDNFKVLADGYAESSHCLINSVLNTDWNNQRDILIFPILFNVTHAIELYLKTIISIQHTLLEDNSTFKNIHVLSKLFEKVICLENQGGFLKEKLNLESYLKEVEKVIIELETTSKRTMKKTNKKESDFTFPRYPLGKDFNKQFYIGDFNEVDYIENVVIDVENLECILKRVFGVLESVYWEYDVLLGELYNKKKNLL